MSSSSRQRGLLFGIFAVQLHKVSTTDIAEAAAIWIDRPDADFADVLEERGFVSGAAREFIARLVDAAIAADDNNLANALNSVGGADAVARVFRHSIALSEDGDIVMSEPAEGYTELDEPTDSLPLADSSTRYVDEFEFARGGMGRVLIAHDAVLRRKIALKELLPPSPRATADGQITPMRRTADEVARFLREARVASQLQHPSIIPVYELGKRADGKPYYTMKLVEGKTLADAIRSAKSAEQRLGFLRHFLDLCEAVAYAHSRGVIHRDLKPSNVMIGEFGETVLIDWGLARVLGEDDIHAEELRETYTPVDVGGEPGYEETQYGKLKGTLPYMSPEQVRGDIDLLDERSDVYALGAVLYEILTGRPPFLEHEAPLIRTRKMILEHDPEPPETIEHSVPLALSAVCKKAMSKNPSHRYPTAKALAEDVLNFSTGQLVGAHRYLLAVLAWHYARRYRVYLAAIVVLFALICAGLWSWNYNRLRVEYYANIASRWGVPVGIGPLDPETRAGRKNHYRFESRRYKVRRVLHVNSAGRLTNDEACYGAASQDVSYNGDGTVQQIELRNRDGKLVMTLGFNSLQDRDGTKVHYIEHRQEHREAPAALPASLGVLDSYFDYSDETAHSDISVYQVFYSSEGLPDTVSFLNAYRENRANVDGSFGQRFRYEGKFPRPVRIENLDIQGVSQPNPRGVFAVERAYDRLGDLAEERFLDAAGQPAPTYEGYARKHVQNNRFGNCVEEVYFGAAGEAIRTTSGYHLQKNVYDNRGNLTSLSFYDVDGEPAVCADGFHRLVATYDSRGCATEMTAFDLKGEPASTFGVFVKCTFEYDSRGNLTGAFLLDTDGEAMTDAGEIWGIKLTVDQSGNLVGWAFFGQDGTPMLVDGYHRIAATYDERGNKSDESYFGMNGEPVLSPDGYHRVTYIYDPRGNEIEQSYYGLENQPILNDYGYHRTAHVYNSQGSTTEQSYFGLDNKPVLNRNLPNQSGDAYHRVSYAFDERGNKVEESYFGLNGEAVSYNGYHRASYAYDERGNSASESYFDVDNKALLRNGFHRRSQDYDKRGNKIGVSYFGVSGEAILLNGYHRVTFAYDVRGNEIEEVYYGVHDEPILREGHHIIMYAYDKKNNETEHSYFGLQGEPILDSDGVHRRTQDYDAHGNIVSWSHFGVAGEPVLYSNAYHRHSRIYDEQRRVTEESFFGVNGEAVAHNGYHRITYVYDARGNKLEESYFGLDDTPVLYKGFHRFMQEFDERDNCVNLAYFGAMGEPVLCADGYHRLARRYDDRGNTINWQCFGVDGNPVLNTNGYHQLIQAFDESGKMTNQIFLDVKGQPLNRGSAAEQIIRELRDKSP